MSELNLNPDRRPVSCADVHRAFGQEVVAPVYAQFGVKVTFDEPVQRTVTETIFGARTAADMFDVPPWMLDSALDTRRERLRWRLRKLRRAWNWLTRKVRGV